MKINKSLDIDLNIISPQRNIRIHEGDIDSIDIVLAVSVDDVSLDLTGLTIKYDATINNYLAEQDANGSVVENKIVIPVTENMTAMPGLLLIDVRMIQGDEVLFTQTISAIVDKAVVNGSTYIDFSKITIVQRMNALEEQMAHVEEIVDGLDTSKQITSNRRPPQTAPSTVDVDFFRVGDTWICQGSNIVYKLVEAEYNYQPDPEVPAVHKFTWQPLNEYFSFGTSEPPTSATYTPIEYVIGELTFTALPVPEYFKGDTYAQLVSGEIQALSVLTNAVEVSAGQYTFSWHENGGGDNKNVEIINVHQSSRDYRIFSPDLTLGEILNLAKTKHVIARFNGLYRNSNGIELETVIDWVILSAGHTPGSNIRVIALNPNGEINSTNNLSLHGLRLFWDGTANNYAYSKSEIDSMIGDIETALSEV